MVHFQADLKLNWKIRFLIGSSGRRLVMFTLGLGFGFFLQETMVLQLLTQKVPHSQTHLQKQNQTKPRLLKLWKICSSPHLHLAPYRTPGYKVTELRLCGLFVSI